MRLVKKSFKALLLLTVLVLFVFFTGGSVWLHLYGRDWLQKKGQALLPIQISVEKTRFQSFNSIRIDNIHLKSKADRPGAAFEGTIQTLIVSMRPWFLLFPGTQHKIITGVLWRPSLHIFLPSEIPRKEKKERRGLFLYPYAFSGEIKGGHLYIHREAELHQINNVSASVALLPTQITGLGIGTIKGLGPISTSFFLSTRRKGTWKANVASNNVDIASALSYGKWNLPAVGEINGNVNIDLSAEGSWPPDSSSQIRWTMTAEGKRLQWKKDGALIPLAFQAQLSPTLLSIPFARLDHHLVLRGNVTDPFRNPVLNLHLEANQWPFSHLEHLLPMMPLPLGGSLSGSGNMTGPLHNPTLLGEFNANPAFGRTRLPSWQGNIALENQHLLIESNFADGQVRMKGSTKEGFRIHDIDLRGIRLESWASLYGWDKLKGSLQAQFNLGTDVTFPSINGTFSLKHFQWGDTVATDTLRGFITSVKDNIVLETLNKTLVIRASRKPDKILIEEARLSTDLGSGLLLAGDINTAMGRLNLNVHAENIPMDWTPPLLKIYPSIQGSIDLEGAIHGAFGSPEGDLSTRLNRVRLASGGALWSGGARLEWKKGGLRLTDIETDNGYQGALRYKKGEGHPMWEGSVQCKKADPRLLFDIFKSTAPTKGHIDGHLNIESQGSHVLARSSFTWTDGQWDRTGFDRWSANASLNNTHVELNNMEWLQGEKLLRAAGTLHKKDEHWLYDLQGQMQKFGADPLSIDGEIQTQGQVSLKEKNISGSLTSQALWINEIPIDRFQLTYRKEGQRLALNWEALPVIQGNLNLNLSNREIQGKGEAKSIDIEKIWSGFFSSINLSENPKGLCDIAATISGSLESPVIRVKMNASRVTFRNENFSTQLFLTVTPPLIMLTSAKTTLEKGGTLISSGTVTLTEELPILFHGAGTQLNLQSVLNIMDWPLYWDGRMDATFLVKYLSGKKTMDITFAGEHDGIGPFTAKGKLAGRVETVGNDIDLSGIRVTSGDGYVIARHGSHIFLNRDDSGKLRLLLDSRNLKLGVLTLFGGVEMTGSWESSQPGSMADTSPFALDIFARSLWVNQFVLQGNVTRLIFEEDQLRFTPIIGSGQQLSGLLVYKEYPALQVKRLQLVEDGKEKFFLDGDVGKEKWGFILRTNDIEADIIRGLFDTTVPIEGRINIELEGKGSFDDPRIKSRLTWMNGKIGALPLDLATCDLTYEDDVLQVKNINAQKRKGYQLYGQMRLPDLSQEESANPPTIEIEVVKGNMALLKDVWPSCTKARGSFEGRFHMKNQAGTPSLEGYFNAENVQFKSTAYLPHLSKGELRLRFDQNKILIDGAKAVVGNGRVKLDGHIALDRFQPASYDLTLDTPEEDGIAINAPELSIPTGPFLGRFQILRKKLAGLSQGEPKIHLTLKGPASAPLLAGNIRLENTIFTYPPIPGSSDESALSLGSLSYLRDLRKDLRWDVVISAGKKTWYQNELVDAKIAGSLHLSGPTSDIFVNGRIISDKGSIVYSGNEFEIKEAILEVVTQTNPFDPNEKSQTYVYLKANTEKEVHYTDALGDQNSDTVMMIVDRALLGEIQPRFVSKNNPGLPSQKALQLALGIPVTEATAVNPLMPKPTGAPKTADGTTETDLMLRASLVQLLDSSLASPLARAIARRTGLVDFIRITYQDTTTPAIESPATPGDKTATATNATQNQVIKYMKGARVKFGKELTGRLFADYSVKVDEFENQLDFRHEVELAYRLHHNLFVRATTELETQNTAGRPPEKRAYLENRWRFGLPKKKKTPTPTPNERE